MTLSLVWIAEDEHLLEVGEAQSIERLGQTLSVLSGVAWISFDGLDLMVAAGEEIVLVPGLDAAVISPLEAQPLVYCLCSA
ncbi:MAG TPA: hypothetical protein VHP83_12715 [Aggregatilineaceae bacterium]|nr:hypothetical protein [Aggregatilineaceae bacterium]